MQRLPIVAMLLATAACNARTAEQPVAEAAAITFDGAAVKQAAAQRAHGERLTRVLGCRGCHGKELEGELWDDDPKEYGVMWASNLTRAVPTMSDPQLRALLFAGAHPRRNRMWVMPSELFQHLAAADRDALIAYLRSMRPVGQLSPEPQPGPLALRQIASGEIKPAATLVKELKAVGPLDLGEQHAQGRYITQATCAECHGPQLKGAPGDTPDLITAGAYSRAEFERLITRGEATGKRKLKPLMVSVAKSRFAHLTPAERDALYAYLKARAEAPQ